MRLERQVRVCMRTAGILVFCFALSGCSRREASTNVRVEVAQARQVTTQVIFSAPATIYPTRQASIIPRLTAPIRELRAAEGDEVEAGDVLAVLDNRGVLAQQESALAALEDAKTALRRALAAGPAVIEGERARTKGPEFPGARDLLREPMIAANPIGPDLTAAEDRVRQAQDRLDGINAQLANAEVRTPIAGTVISQLNDVGDVVGPAAPVFVVADLSSVAARAQVPQESQHLVKAAMPCSFTLKNSSGPAVKGRISAAVRPGTASCELYNRAGLAPRQLGTLTVDTGVTRPEIVIPAAALHASDAGAFVLVVDSKHVVHRRTVQPGLAIGSQIAITRGIVPGETVVIAGLPSDGAHVQY